MADHALPRRSHQWTGDCHGQAGVPEIDIRVPEDRWAYWTDESSASRESEALKPNFANVKLVFDELGQKATQLKPRRRGRFRRLALCHSGPYAGTLDGDDLVGQQGGGAGRRHQLPKVFVRNPGWHARFDMDAAQAEATRRKLYDRAVSEGFLISGYRYPFPSVGRISREGKGYPVDLL